jgi:hypothetical protein
MSGKERICQFMSGKVRLGQVSLGCHVMVCYFRLG